MLAIFDVGCLCLEFAEFEGEMVKKTNTKRRGIQRGVQRHKIGAKRVTEKVTFLVKLVYTTGLDSGHIYLAAKYLTEYLQKVCTLCCIIPIELSSRGQYKPAPLWKRNIHYVLALFYLSFLLYKIYITMRVLLFEDLTGATFLCACSAIALAVGISGSLGTSWTTTEALGVLNSFESLKKSMGESFETEFRLRETIPLSLKLIAVTCGSHCADQVQDLMKAFEPLGRTLLGDSAGKQVEVVENVSVCLKFIAGVFIAHCVAFNAAAFSLVNEELPVCVFPLMNKLGIIPETNFPVILWQFMKYSLELLTLLPPLLAFAFNVKMLVTGLGMMEMYADELRFQPLN